MDYEAVSGSDKTLSRGEAALFARHPELGAALVARLRRSMAVDPSERIDILAELFGQMRRPPYRVLLECPEFRSQLMEKAYSLLAELSSLPATTDWREKKRRANFRGVLAELIAEMRTIGAS
ncbi:MAG: hypothetical protein WC700_10165 [Gemmatimonadaceae bacterium]|jgi:hypothetical protein